MKTTLVLFIFSVAVYCSCKKQHDKVFIDTCNGIATDTAGTNDTAWVAMPNCFTPNSDGINDLLRPVPYGVDSINFTLWDENYNMVFMTNQLLQGFAPSPAVSFAKYYYNFQARTNQGHQVSGCGEVYALACLPSSLQGTTLYLEDMLLLNGHFQSPSQDPALTHACQ